MASFTRYVLCLSFTGLAFLAVAAQAATLPTAVPGSAEGLIKIDVRVTNKLGTPVSGLTKQDFTILDDGSPRDILSFHSSNHSLEITDPPVELVLVIDAINQDAKQIAFVAQQIGSFLRRNEGRLAEPVSLVLVSNDGLSFQPQPSLEGKALASVIDRLKVNLAPAQPPETLQELQRRFKLSVLQMMVIARKEAQKPGRKLLLWIGPGWPMPTCSSLSRAQDRVRCGLGMPLRAPPKFAVGGQHGTLSDQQRYFYQIVELGTLLREGRTSVYKISPFSDASISSPAQAESYPEFLQGVKSAAQANAGDLSLEVLAIQSGGEVRKADNHVADLIASCVGNADNSYTLSFDPPRTPRRNEYHELHVVVNRPGLTVRTITGYYDQPGIPIKYLSVAQLEHVVQAVRKIPDSEAARRLSGLVLTERLTGPALSSLESRLPGAKARQMLSALAYASTFLNLPVSEVPRIAPPDANQQRQIVARAVEYLRNTIPKLPNLFASRTTVHYEYAPQKSEHPAAADFSSRYWRLGKTYHAVVLYRDGKEIVQSARGKELGPRTQEQEEGLLVFGVFGPVLSVVLTDAGPSELTWSRWEPGAAGPLAVFRVAVLKSRSHFKTGYHLTAEGTTKIIYQRSGYHGEIAIDPTSGTIYSLALMADPDPSTPILRSDVMVQYGPVEIAGRTYICPVRSVSLSQADMSAFAHREDMSAPEVTFLNSITFSNYHVFRSNSRITTPSLPDEK